MSATNRGAKRAAQDLYQTPQWCIDLLAERVAFDALPLASNLMIIDPGAADGRIGETVLRAMVERHRTPRKLYAVERDPRWVAVAGEHMRAAGHEYVQKDFLEWLQHLRTKPQTPVLFVSNPPFSQAEQWVKFVRAWMLTNAPSNACAVFLLRLNWLGSEKRASWVNDNPPRRITVLAPRPSFRKTKRVDPKTGKVKWSSNDACEYAWVWWDSSPVKCMTHFEVAVRAKERKA